MNTITVFTPTYNRVLTLKRTYDSLLNQTNKDFEWLIIDDGSTDDTGTIVKSWIREAKIPIRYIHKVNGGLHTGYNMAIQNISTELCMCCDSDDYLPENAIEIILNVWHKKGSDQRAGIIGLDFISGQSIPIGGYFTRDDITLHFLELENVLKHKGDVKMVHRTDILKPYVPMPSFSGEKNFNPIYIFLQVNPNLDYIILNENICNVDYQPNGMSANIYYQYKNSPRSFAEIRKARIKHPKIGRLRKIIDSSHLVSSALLAHDIKVLRGMKDWWMLLVGIPVGIAIFALVLFKTRKE